MSYSQDVPVTRSRSIVNESPDVPQFAHEFHIGLEDVTKSNEGIESALEYGALGLGLGYLARIARSVEG